MTDNNTSPDVDHSARGHAKFSPSQLKYLAACPGYEGAGGTSPAAEAGTRIHEAMETRNPTALMDDEEREVYDQLCETEDGILAEFRKVVPDADEVIMDEALLDIEAGSQSTYGSCDKLIVRGARAVMIDYKTGVGHIDEPLVNHQAKAYTLGVFQKFPEVGVVTFYFLVPKRGEILYDIFERDDVPLLEQEIEQIITRAAATRPLWASGEQQAENLAVGDNCQFCKYNMTCPAVTGLAVAVAKGLRPSDLPDDLDPEFIEKPDELGKALAISRVLEKWAGNVRRQATSIALDGTEIPGFRLRSMGTPRKLIRLRELAESDALDAYGIGEAELWDAAKVSMSGLSKPISAQAPRGSKKARVEAFQTRLEDEGFVEWGEERHTMEPQKS